MTFYKNELCEKFNVQKEGNKGTEGKKKNF